MKSNTDQNQKPLSETIQRIKGKLEENKKEGGASKEEKQKPTDDILQGLTDEIKQKRGVRKPVDYNPKFIQEVIRHIGLGYTSDFVFDKQNAAPYKQLIKYFMGDATFDGDLNKGLLLVGPKGTGKTLALIIMNHVVQKFNLDTRSFGEYSGKFLSFQIFRAMKVTELFEINGHTGINKFKAGKPICFDDLGEEPKTAKHYLNEINVMKHILTERNLMFMLNGVVTHATTNYPLQDKGTGERYFKSFYGDRVDDRIREMFNVIKFIGESRRK